MITIEHLTYLHPNKDVLFNNLNFSLTKQQKVALIGNNGVGKSTLLKIAAGHLQPNHGSAKTECKPYYIPQIFGQFNELTISEALNIADKLEAFYEILEGNVTEENQTILDDDWTIEEHCLQALSYWSLDGLVLNTKMKELSGGQKTKVFLAGILIHEPEVILMDEPSNHLDKEGRELLYNFIESSSATMMVVSHDRTLLNLLQQVYELSQHGIASYGGNYDFYAEQKQIEAEAFDRDLKSKEKALRKAKELEQGAAEKQQKLDARGKKKQEKAGMPKIMMNTLRNKAENSTSRMKGVHAEKTAAIAAELNALRKEIPDADKMKFSVDSSAAHNGKILVTAVNVVFKYTSDSLWRRPPDFQITSTERIELQGSNGSGKTTLIKLILGELEPTTGTISRAKTKSIYIDQDYSLINNHLSVFEQAQLFNNSTLQEHEIKIRLNRFLFDKDYWDRPCSILSGGEKMRLMLCCLTISSQAPDLIVLDEPTNNLDMQNIEILMAAINQYRGALIVVSHDHYFLQQINVLQSIDLNSYQ